MNAREVLYRLSVVGSFAAFLSWTAREWVSSVLLAPQRGSQIQKASEIADRVDLVLIASLMCVFCVWFGSRWWGQRSYGRRVLDTLVALLLGGGLGGLSAWLVELSRARWSDRLPHWILMIIAWGLLGIGVGFLIGALRGGFIPARRPAISALGGALGGILGGSLALAGQWAPYALQALGLMVVGFSIACFSTWAVQVISRASFKLEHSTPEVLALFKGKTAVWELIPGDRYLIGKGTVPEDVNQYIYIPDDGMADCHAWISSLGKDFRVIPHMDNQDGSGNPVQILTVESADWREEPNGHSGGTVLHHGDVITMGNTRFSFHTKAQAISSRNRQAIKKAGGLLILTAVLFSFPRAASAAPADISAPRLIQSDRGVLCEYGTGSEKPALRVTMNVRDLNGAPIRVPVLDPRALQVFEGPHELTIVSDSQKKLERYAILLVDVSGSMLQPTSDGARKFDAAVEACRAFAGDFVNGIDHVAVIPFGSRGVAAGVRDAVFHTEKEDLDRAIAAIRPPLRTSNTGLYTAVYAAALRIQQLQKESSGLANIDRRYLIVPLTDGMNAFDPRKNDDPDLLYRIDPVRELVDQLSIQVITVGLGNEANLDEPALRSLAWPDSSNYLRTSGSAELEQAFRLARSMLVERLGITFLFRERYRAQLLSPHSFRVTLQVAGSRLDGMLRWVPPSQMFAPPFEGVIAVPQKTQQRPWIYWIIVVAGFLVHAGLWFWLPKRLWKDEHDAQFLRERALNVIKR